METQGEDQGQEPGLDLGRYLAVLWKWRLHIAASAVMAGLLALGASFLLPPVFEAEVQVAVVKSGTLVSFDSRIKSVSEFESVTLVDQTARRKALTAMAQSPDLAAAVVRALGDRLAVGMRAPRLLADAVDVTSDGDMIKIKGRSGNPAQAKLIADTWAAEFVDRISDLYGETPQTPAEIQSQAAGARQDYDRAEAALVAYLAANPVDQLQLQIAEKQQVLSSLRAAPGSGAAGSNNYLDALIAARRAVLNAQSSAVTQRLADLYVVRNRVDRLLADATALRNRLSAGSTSARGDELAAMLLEASAFSGWSQLAITLQVSLDQPLAAASPAEQIRQADDLIASLKERRRTTQVEIDSLAGGLVASAGADFRDAQLQALDTLTGYAAANEPINKVMSQLQVEINGLQARVEQEAATKAELTRARDLAWTSYSTLATKVAEVTIAAQSKGSLVRVASPAVAPDAPSAPRKAQNALLGATLGLFVAAAGFLALELRRDALDNAGQVTAALHLTALGEIPQARGKAALLMVEHEAGATVEAFRMLRHCLLSSSTPWKALLVASALPGEGKTTVAANLAVLLAQVGRRVILVDANLREPALHTAFGLGNERGLTDVLSGGVGGSGLAQATGVPGLWLLTSGPLSGDPTRLLEMPELAALMENLRAAYDAVIVDAPATIGLADAPAMARHADGILMVAASGKTARRDVTGALESLCANGTPVAGVVLNRARA
jgi:capsular exopolysaccharide synthesis family protein